ncbi:uncharacterized protein LODBEIA_P43170 [Lodderomyces beijingensis]|uniref:Uncharacterized protein n=1 Tax=Lodderomyces beijingensis TaxID=1775926 RepID=A0ABP0ZPK8_9ASCO
MPSQDEELTRFEILDSNLRGLLQRDTVANIIRRHLKKDESKLREFDLIRADENMTSVSVDSNKMLVLTMLLGQVVYEALTWALNMELETDLQLSTCQFEPRGGGQCPEVLIRRGAQRRSLESLFAQLSITWKDGIFVPREAGGDGGGDGNDEDTGELPRDSDLEQDCDEFRVDLENWYCDCIQYQSSIDLKSLLLDKSTADVLQFNESNHDNFIWQLLYQSRCNQLVPSPICCHLLALLIVLYNYDILDEESILVANKRTT